MGNLLSIGTQGILTTQRQLNTTGHNISNVNTEGYSRQSIEQQTADTHYSGGQYFGSGVLVADIRRNFDKFAISEFNIATSSHSHAVSRNEQLGILDELMASSGKKVPENINQFFSAVKAMTDTPNDMGARKIVLEQAKMAADSIKDISGILERQAFEVNDEIDVTVARVNAIGQELVDVQQAILKSGGKDNDLFDRQQNLLNELSKYTQITTNMRRDGLFNVLIGSGHTLVSGVHASKLTTIEGSPDVQQRRLAIVTGNNLKAISSEDIRGKLEGLFDYRDKTLGMARDELGRMAMGFAMALNELQSQGFDLKGNVGKAMFNDFNHPDVAKSRVDKASDSTAELSVFIDDISKIRTGDYQVRFDGVKHTVTMPDQKEQVVTPVGAPPTFIIDGMRIEINQPMATGERLLIRPVRDAAARIDMIMSDPSEIAAQSYISSTSQLNGDAKLQIETRGAQTQFQVVISEDGSQFSIFDLEGNLLQSPQSYPPAGPVLLNGTVFSLTAGAEKNDRFVISLLPADGENGNLLRMQKLQTSKFMDNGRATLIDVFEGLTSSIGAQKSSFANLEGLTRTELDAAQGRVAKVSGVNLDEEAANMMKFQQAYMASSRIMTAANQAFETLLNATR
ncbi:MAG: flagellar hook-associated protein FlgK [Vibrionaceae bacterium]